MFERARTTLQLFCRSHIRILLLLLELIQLLSVSVVLARALVLVGSVTILDKAETHQTNMPVSTMDTFFLIKGGQSQRRQLSHL